MVDNYNLDHSPLMNEVSRRKFLKAGLIGLGSTLALPSAAHAAIKLPGTGSFDISFSNQHTGEKFSGTYRVGDKYLPDAFDEINKVLRDFRANEVFPIDPRVIDIIYMVKEKTERNDILEVLSGYRSPKTNDRLRKAGNGVAKNSLHMTGQALDFRLPGFSTRKLTNLAANLKAGGVGFYSGSNFVHVDTGRVRRW
jgi:uncharacterized protein YcbK (DUF882 family)